MRVYRFFQKQYALQALRDQRLKVTRLNELNDPFELFSMDLSDQSMRRRFIKWKARIAARTGVICFSRRWRAPPLWSHYADRHRGMAVEFEVDDDLLVPMRYRATRRKLDIDRIAAIGGFSGDLAEVLYSTKAKHWKYEEEFRVQVALANCQRVGDLMFEPLGPQIRIVGVVPGALCRTSGQEIASHLPIGHNVTLHRARLAFKSFLIVRNKAYSPEVVEGVA